MTLGLVNTRFGVFLVFDVFGDIGDANVQTSPHDGPLDPDRMIRSAATYPLPDVIEQPSGIEYLADRASFVINTDQAELFELSSEFDSISSKTQLMGGPLLFRQGSIEGVVAIEDSILFAGEIGHLKEWAIVNDAWSSKSEIMLPGEYDDAEWSAIARNPETGELYLASDEQFQIDIFDASGAFVRSLIPEAPENSKRSLSEFMISGLDFEDGHLYVVTENFATLLKLDTDSAAIKEFIGLEDAGEVSDLVVVNNKAYVTIDHNLFDERPGVRVYELGTD